MLVIPSPAAILKGTEHLAASQKFIDFLLSEDGQKSLLTKGHYQLEKALNLMLNLVCHL